jgi:dUTP pyrophosphatase
LETIDIAISKKEGAFLPVYATETCSGMDLFAFVDAPVTLQPLERVLIPTGISVAIPQGFEAEVRPRSGMANNFGVTVLNTPGTIDADYRGEIKVLLINLGHKPFTISNGDRVAQMIIKSVYQAVWSIVDALPETTRGDGGFGSTGMR